MLDERTRETTGAQTTTVKATGVPSTDAPSTGGTGGVPADVQTAGSATASSGPSSVGSPAAPPLPDVDKEAVFDSLWARMVAVGDLPSLRFSAQHPVSKLNDRQASLGELASLVLSDLAFAQMVIRLANSPMYRTLGGEVNTVSRAILVLGVSTVEHLSLGLQLISQFKTSAACRANGRRALKRALMAADFTRAITRKRSARESEEAVLCSLLHPLAQLLVMLYFEKEWEQMAVLCSADASLSLNEACRQTLSVSLEDVADAAARKWGLPKTVATSMCAALPLAGSPPDTYEGWLAALAAVATEAAKMADSDIPREEVAAAIEPLLKTLALSLEDTPDAISAAHEAGVMVDASEEAAEAATEQATDRKPLRAATVMAHALEEIRAAAPALATGTGVMPWVVESIMKALHLKSAFMMLLNPPTKHYTARFGFGADVRERLPALQFSTEFSPDIFHLAATRTRPLFFPDLTEHGVAHRVPDWYKSQFPDTKSLILIPVRLRGNCIGMICGTWGEPSQSAGLTEEELGLLAELSQEVSRTFERSATGGRS